MSEFSINVKQLLGSILGRRQQSSHSREQLRSHRKTIRASECNHDGVNAASCECEAAMVALPG
jgi:hypothetical protein